MTAPEPLGVQLWWHAYGGVRADLGCHQLVIYGGGTTSPKLAAEMEMTDGMTYLASWDHEPTDLEKEEVTPPEYRDEFGPLAHTIPAVGE